MLIHFQPDHHIHLIIPRKKTVYGRSASNFDHQMFGMCYKSHWSNLFQSLHLKNILKIKHSSVLSQLVNV